MFALLIKVLRSDDPHVAAIGAAAVWCLAQEDGTLRRMPVGKLVAALLHTYPAVLPTDRSDADEEGGEEGDAEEGAGEAGGTSAEGGGAAEEEEEELTESDDTEAEQAARLKQEAEEEFARHSDIVHAAIGKRLEELQYLPIRALHALMKNDAGRRSFHRNLGSLRMLPLLCHHDDAISSAVAALFSRATGASAAICGDTLFRGGAGMLVRMAAGFSDEFHPYEKRCLAADLLHFCVSRIKLRPVRASPPAGEGRPASAGWGAGGGEDRMARGPLHLTCARRVRPQNNPNDIAFLDEIPALMSLLRVSTLPLFIPINAATKLSHPLFAASKTQEQLNTAFQRAERALVLLRGVIGTMWGMAAMLRATGRTAPVSSTMLALLLRLLAFRPDRDLRGKVIGGAFAQTRSEHAHALRNAALGVMACMELKPEQALQYADLEEVEQEAAVKKLQGMRRSQIKRRRAAEKARQMELEKSKAGSSEDSGRTSPAPAPMSRKKRASNSKSDTAEPTPAPAAPEVVVPPKILPTQLLGLLEELVGTPATRFTECCAAALCSLVTKPTVSIALAAADALTRILSLCEQLQRAGPLHGHASVAHGYLAASALSLLEARLQRAAEKAAAPAAAPVVPAAAAAEASEKPKRDASATAQRAGAPKGLTPSTSTVSLGASAATTALAEVPDPAVEEGALTEQQLGIMVGMLPASQPGALHGAAALWLMANSGAVEQLGELGAVEACAAALAAAVEEKKLTGHFLLQASWACAALWRLAHSPVNAARMLACAAPTLLRLLPEGAAEHDALRKAALGCVSLMLRQPELQPPLVQMAAPALLRDLAGSVDRPAEQRLTATRTLDEAVIHVPNLLPPPPEPVSISDGDGSGGVLLDKSAAAAEAGDANLDGSGLELLMLSLLKDKDPELRALGCRGLARAAMRGAEKRIVDNGGCKALMMQLRAESERYLAQLSAEDTDATAPTSSSPRAAKTVPAGLGGGRGVARSPRAAAAQNAVDLADAQAAAVLAAKESNPDQPDTLLRDALSAVLNLSGARCAQQQLARHGLWTLVQLWYNAQLQSPESELAQLARMAGGILVNLACHPANRTLMYRAELQLKTAACAGMPLRARPATPPPQPAEATAGHADEHDDYMEEEYGDVGPSGAEGDETGASALDKEEEDGDKGDGATATGAAPTSGGPMVDEATKDVKKRYIHWLTTTMREVDAERARERAEVAEAKKREQAQTGTGSAELARTAFRLIDVSNDGELTRTEVIRAFRVNDQVRQLLLPLLPAELLGKSNSAVSGVDVQAQVEAFEVTFQRMDVDGSNAVTLEEFENYFTSIAVHGGNAAVPRRASNLQPNPKGKGRKKSMRSALQIGDGPVGRGDAGGMAQSSSGGALPAIKGAAAKPEHGAGSSPVRKGISAPGLQRLMQTSYTDTWRKAVSVPTTKSARNASGKAALSPRTAASQRSGAATTCASARAELNEMSSPGASPLTGAAKRAVPAGRALVPLHAGHGGATSDRSKAAGPWAPPVEELSLMPEEAKSASRKGLEQWEEEYLAGETPLRFEVKLPAAEEYTPHFRFTGDEGGGMQDARSGAMGGKLVYWPAAPPAKLSKRVAKQLGRDTVTSEVARLCGFAGFKLPDGRELRLFHASQKRNWKAPAQEPVEPTPSSLATLGMASLPPHPPPPQPSRRDVQKLTTSEVRAPRPRKETRSADAADGAYSYGDTEIEAETLTLVVNPASGAAGMDLLPIGSKKDVPFDLFSSVFASRRVTTDGKSFYDDEQVVRRAFEIDFARCNQERFRLLIREEDDDTADVDGDGVPDSGAANSESTEIGEIKEVLCKHRDTFYSAFRYYSALGAINERGDGFAIGPEDFEAFCKKCKLADEASSSCKMADLQQIFNTTNEEEDTLDEQKEMAEVNLDRALLRFEFMQCLVRIAIAKYVHGGESTKTRTKKIADVSEALNELLTKDIAPNLPPEGQGRWRIPPPPPHREPRPVAKLHCTRYSYALRLHRSLTAFSRNVPVRFSAQFPLMFSVGVGFTRKRSTTPSSVRSSSCVQFSTSTRRPATIRRRPRQSRL